MVFFLNTYCLVRKSCFKNPVNVTILNIRRRCIKLLVKSYLLDVGVLGVSGGYWVRRIRQLPRAPLKNSIYSLSLLQMFFRDYYEVGTKSGKYKIDSSR